MLGAPPFHNVGDCTHMVHLRQVLVVIMSGLYSSFPYSFVKGKNLGPAEMIT